VDHHVLRQVRIRNQEGEGMNKRTLIALALGLASINAGSECSTGTGSTTEVVRDVWRPGHYDAGLCVNDTHWLLKIENIKTGWTGARCVDASNGRKQRIGSPYRP